MSREFRGKIPPPPSGCKSEFTYMLDPQTGRFEWQVGCAKVDDRSCPVSRITRFPAGKEQLLEMVEGPNGPYPRVAGDAEQERRVNQTGNDQLARVGEVCPLNSQN